MRRRTTRTLSATVCGSFLGIYALALNSLPQDSVAPESAPWVDLFDGESTRGWHHIGGGEFRIEDGTLIADGPAPGKGFLVTDREYADFELELEVRMIRGNSGIQIRSQALDRHVRGYQIELDASPRAWTGGLYDESRRAWMRPVQDPEKRKAFRIGEWNLIRIRCHGAHIQSWVNGVPITDEFDAMDVSGVIALQDHDPGSDVRFRNIRIREHGAHTWAPLLEEGFEGWGQVGEGSWEWNEGVLEGRHRADQASHGLLLTDRRFTDFTARLRFRSVEGNSGFYVRVDKRGPAGVSGFQAEIDPEKAVGGLYETAGRAWVVQPDAETVAKYNRSGDWNTMEVTAHGDRLLVSVNGTRTAELVGDPGRREGHLALQLHGKQDVVVDFAEVEWLVPGEGR